MRLIDLANEIGCNRQTLSGWVELDEIPTFKNEQMAICVSDEDAEKLRNHKPGKRGGWKGKASGRTLSDNYKLGLVTRISAYGAYR